jgi:hypothetical protein
VALDLAFNFILGVAFALCGRERIRIDGLFAPPAFWLVLIFAGIILIPLAFYLYMAHPAWTWMYTVDPEAVPSILLLPLLVGHGLMFVGGWLVGGKLVRNHKTRQALYGVLGASVLLIVMVLLFWGRLGHYGTYEEFTDGRALQLMEVKLGYVLIVILLGLGAAAVLTALQLVHDSRRATTK